VADRRAGSGPGAVIRGCRLAAARDRGRILDRQSADSPAQSWRPRWQRRSPPRSKTISTEARPLRRCGPGSAARSTKIDLNKKNARAFRKHLAPFVEHARKAGPGPRHQPARTAASRQRSGDIRAWAKATGRPVSARGRIPASVVDQYQATTQRP
jgi:hypothetical protein